MFQLSQISAAKLYYAMQDFGFGRLRFKFRIPKLELCIVFKAVLLPLHDA